MSVRTKQIYTFGSVWHEHEGVEYGMDSFGNFKGSKYVETNELYAVGGGDGYRQRYERGRKEITFVISDDKVPQEVKNILLKKAIKKEEQMKILREKESRKIEEQNKRKKELERRLEEFGLYDLLDLMGLTKNDVFCAHFEDGNFKLYLKGIMQYLTIKEGATKSELLDKAIETWPNKF